MKAVWKNAVIAESDDVIVVEGNHYFALKDVNMHYITPSDTKTTCPWKGVASYYTINVDGQLNEDAAWYYPQPKSAANNIQGRVAFWHGVSVVD